jgi:hypothetical protein
MIGGSRGTILVIAGAPLQSGQCLQLFAAVTEVRQAGSVKRLIRIWAALLEGARTEPFDLPRGEQSLLENIMATDLITGLVGLTIGSP